MSINRLNKTFTMAVIAGALVFGTVLVGNAIYDVQAAKSMPTASMSRVELENVAANTLMPRQAGAAEKELGLRDQVKAAIHSEQSPPLDVAPFCLDGWEVVVPDLRGALPALALDQKGRPIPCNQGEEGKMLSLIADSVASRCVGGQKHLLVSKSAGYKPATFSKVLLPLLDETGQPKPCTALNGKDGGSHGLR